MQAGEFRFGPIALTTTMTTNLLNPGTCTGGVNSGSRNLKIKLTHIRFVNKTASAAKVSLWLGATGANAAGTESIAQGLSIAANSYEDWYGEKILRVADFLVGGSDTATALSIEGEGEITVE